MEYKAVAINLEGGGAGRGGAGRGGAGRGGAGKGRERERLACNGLPSH